MPKYIILVTNF